MQVNLITAPRGWLMAILLAPRVDDKYPPFFHSTTSFQQQQNHTLLSL
jgi:hypothetical protein